MRNSHKYPPNWIDEIRPAILKRDKFICQHCNAKHRKSYVWLRDGTKFMIPDSEIAEWKGYGDKAYKVFLQIAHLDRDPSNNEYVNLKALCPRCHLNYDRPVNKLNRNLKYK